MWMYRQVLQVWMQQRRTGGGRRPALVHGLQVSVPDSWSVQQQAEWQATMTEAGSTGQSWLV